MADYSTIKGFTIQSLATDPVATAVEAGTWASGNNLNTAKGYGASGGTSAVGTQTNAVNATGANASDFLTLETELYDGTSWTVSPGTLTTGRTGGGGAGVSSTSAIMFGGFIPPATRSDVSETWNGSTWTEGNNLNSGRNDTSGSGIVTAAFCVAGYDGPSSSAVMETYDGTCWTETNNLNRSTSGGVAMGLTTAGIYAGGPSPSALVETWDGTSWTEVGDLNSGRYKGSGAGNSSNTANIIFGGGEPVPTDGAKTESWNGTAWTELADLSTALIGNGGCGTNTVGLNVGGSTSPAPGNQQVATEEWTTSTASVAQTGQVWYNTTSTVLKGFAQAGTGAWASGGDINTARTQCGSAGTQDAALQFLGESPYADKNRTEEYDGTSWTETNNCNTARQSPAVTIGTQTTAIAAGGNPGGSLNEQYDGSCWAEGADLNSSAYSKGGAGSSTAGMAWGGASPSVIASNEEWNGTSWSEVNNINTARKMCNGAGTQTAAVTAGGQSPPFVAITETWDGTSWTEVGNLNANCTEYSSANAGSSTAWMQYGGARPALAATCEEWNGTSWSAVASMATARQAVGGGGTTLAGLVAGSNAPLTAACEEFTVPYATKTFTAS